MDLIIDTCGLLSLSGFAERALTAETLGRISEADALIVSACSLFEISLKIKRGNLDLAPFSTGRAYWDRVVENYGIEVASVTDKDLVRTGDIGNKYSKDIGYTSA